MSNLSQRRPQTDDHKEMTLDDGWDALEVAKMSLGAFRHNHTAEPVTSPLRQVRESEDSTGTPGVTK